MEKETKGLIKKFHTICGRLGMTEEERRAMLSANYGVASSLDMTASQLMELCNALDGRLRPAAGDTDRWRKRLIAAIFGYFKAMGRQTDMSEVKRVACRAAEASDFNRIQLERLRSLYYAFRNRKKDMEAVAAITWYERLRTIGLN